MTKKEYDWSRFTVRINVKAPVEKLYKAWATRSGMERWFLRLSEYKKVNGDLLGDSELVEAGDIYQWLWHGWDDDTSEKGSILNCNGKDFFKFSFGNAGDCAITIKEEQGEIVVELVQDNIPTDTLSMHQWHLGCKTGWTFYLANLKSVYEGGIDLRNKNVNLQRVLNS
jgi:uncharacterized protein YndB with AHSA1/START domain